MTSHTGLWEQKKDSAYGVGQSPAHWGCPGVSGGTVTSLKIQMSHGTQRAHPDNLQS